MSFKDSYDKYSNSPQARYINIGATLAMGAYLTRKFRKEPTVWNALPLVRAGIVLVECFKPAKVAE